MDDKQFSLVVCSLSTVLKSQKCEKLHTGETNKTEQFLFKQGIWPLYIFEILQ